MQSPAFEHLLRQSRQNPPVIGIVLGSGLNEIADAWPMIADAAFHELPGMPTTTVAGHRGRLVLCACHERPVLVFQGRIHFYEGHRWDMVARPIQIAAELGVKSILMTNASGGIGSKQTPGSMMLIRKHVAAMNPNWWRDVQKESVYSPEFLHTIRDAATEVNVELSEGVYACMTGPCYETPAEIRALRTIGADAVGMSTVHEANKAAALGLRVAAISCVANWAAGISPTPLSHRDVLETVRSVAGKLGQVISAVISKV